jgi:hypothetical protein
MHVSARSYLTAGVAALSATAIAMAPVQPLNQGSALSTQRISAALAVNLAAAVDPFTLLIDTIQASSDNIEGLIGAVAANPLPIITQVFANIGTYVAELPEIGLIFDQVIDNVGNAFRAPFAPDLDTLDEAHASIYTLLPQVIPDIPQNLLDFLTTPVSGLLIGLIGPVLAPVLSVVNSVQSVIGYLRESDFQSAIFELINIPTNAIGAFLNGGPALDVTSLLASSISPPSVLNSATIALGGLLSPGASIFNAVAVDADIKLGKPPLEIDVPVQLPAGPPAGIFGSLIGLTNQVAEAIVVTPPAEAVVEIAAAADAPVPAVNVAEAAPASTPAEVADPVSEPAQPVAADADTTPAAPRAARAARGAGASSSSGDGAGASTPKRSVRGAASRG